MRLALMGPCWKSTAAIRWKRRSIISHAAARRGRAVLARARSARDVKRHVALVGFMAAGKSTIGRRARARARLRVLRYRRADRACARRVAEIFAREGEAAFRRYERDAIAQVLSNGEGGRCGAGRRRVDDRREPGASEGTRAPRLLKGLARADLGSASKAAASARPLLGRAPTLARIRALYAERLPYYAGADHVVEAERMNDREDPRRYSAVAERTKDRASLTRPRATTIWLSDLRRAGRARRAALLREHARARRGSSCPTRTVRVRALAGRRSRHARAVPVAAFALGESRKRLATVERVLDALLAGGVERGAFVVGVGGGVASDLFGFACATYMRGVRYAHVATSLVAMVDAAIGGKTGVNLRGGKNLAGVFRDPVGVFCDVKRLRTLPDGGVSRGPCGDRQSRRSSKAASFSNPWKSSRRIRCGAGRGSSVIAAAIKVKTMAVADDRLEAGARATLNLGHTFAHAIERASRYRISHGRAVALGSARRGAAGAANRTLQPAASTCAC